MLHSLRCCLCVIVISFISCPGKTSDLATSERGDRTASSASNEEKLSYLDLNNPSIVQAIDANEKDLETAKFVRVDVVEVVNPAKLPVSFQIHYQTPTGERIYLGSFGLFPSDNPGKFIVATRGKVKRAGAVVLSLVTPEKVATSDTIKVGVKKIRFVKD